MAIGRTENVRAFRGDLERFNRLVERRTAGAAAALGALVRRNLALRTPFDTGRAAASWNASLNGPNKRHQPDEAQFAGRAEAAAAGEVNLQGIKLGDSVHVSNSVLYIWRLNAGSSRQAPANFVEEVVQKTRSRRYDKIMGKMVGGIK